MGMLLTPPSDEDDCVLELVDFKWLMAGRGWHIDVSRLHRDSAYAVQCIERGLQSDLPLLRERSVELRPMIHGLGGKSQ
jgi:hypothetical protein